MFKRLGLFTLLLVCIAAYEIYDDNRNYGMEPDGYDDYNGGPVPVTYDYPDVEPYRPQIIRDDPVQSLILYQLFNSLQNREDTRLRLPYRPKFSIMDNPQAGYGPLPFSEMMEFKDAVAKRSQSARNSAKAKGKTSGQKGKPKIAGQHATPTDKPPKETLPTWICYLKACSIRYPTRPTSGFSSG